jgi:hypothetical protein
MAFLFFLACLMIVLILEVWPSKTESWHEEEWENRE